MTVDLMCILKAPPMNNVVKLYFSTDRDLFQWVFDILVTYTYTRRQNTSALLGPSKKLKKIMHSVIYVNSDEDREQ